MRIAKNVFSTTLYLAGAAIVAAGTASISYLCTRGIFSYAREAELHERAKTARKEYYHRGEVFTYPKAYRRGQNDGLRAGYEDGYKVGRTEGYDVGFMAALDGEAYMGSTPEILDQLGIDPEEQAEALKAKAVEEEAKKAEADWDIIKKIFARRDAEKDTAVTLTVGREEEAEMVPNVPEEGIEVSADVPGQSTAEDADDLDTLRKLFGDRDGRHGPTLAPADVPNPAEVLAQQEAEDIALRGDASPDPESDGEFITTPAEACEKMYQEMKGDASPDESAASESDGDGAAVPADHGHGSGAWQME